MIRFVLIIAACFAIIAVGVIMALANGPMPMIPYAQPSGPMTGFGGPMISGNVGVATPPLSGKVLLVNGSSFLLLADGTDKLCLAGGC